jgi:uncharacterized membrane protein
MSEAKVNSGAPESEANRLLREAREQDEAAQRQRAYEEQQAAYERKKRNERLAQIGLVTVIGLVIVAVCATVWRLTLPLCAGITVSAGWFSTGWLFGLYALLVVVAGALSLGFIYLTGMVRRQDNAFRAALFMLVPGILIAAGALSLLSYWFPDYLTVESFWSALTFSLLANGIGHLVHTVVFCIQHLDD